MSLHGLLEKRGDLWWPRADHGCWEWMNRSPDLPDRLMAHCTGFGTVIVAGANAGFYVARYAERFERVIAVEPEPLNFLALTLNCQQANVVKIQAALGFLRDPLSLKNDHECNCGGFYIDETDGIVPVLRIDDIVTRVDAIHLDVEGYEAFALRGGEAVLACDAPVVMVETIENGGRYGVKDEYVSKLLAAAGYTQVERLEHDAIYKRVAT
jgi:FkbM family methyltransferase